MMATAATPERVARYLEKLGDRDRCIQSAAGEAPIGRAGAAEASAQRDAPPSAQESTAFGLIELLLKDQPRLGALARSPDLQRELIPRLLSIGVVGYAIFAAVLCVVFSCARVWPELTALSVWLEHPRQPLVRIARLAEGEFWTPWLDGSVVALVGAYVLGLIGAIGICLPSFYFYSLLAGIRTSMLQVTTSSLVGLASGAIAVLGALPIFLAVVLGLVVFAAPAWAVDAICLVGLVLPFVTGLYGTRALYVGFLGLADSLPEERRDRRACFLRRLLVAWSGCYTAVTPVMIFALWEYFGR
jgi:hypothetical protein